MILTSVAIVFVRYLREAHVALILFAVGFLQLLQNTTIAMILGVFDLNFDSYHLMLAGLLGLVSFIGQMSLTLALKCEQAGLFAIVRTCDVIFAFILQFLFLGVVPDVFRYI
jgi:drug/metabolite transporter (DMT)-like permease